MIPTGQACHHDQVVESGHKAYDQLAEKGRDQAPRAPKGSQKHESAEQHVLTIPNMGVIHSYTMLYDMVYPIKRGEPWVPEEPFLWFICFAEAVPKPFLGSLRNLHRPS